MAGIMGNEEESRGRMRLSDLDSLAAWHYL